MANEKLRAFGPTTLQRVKGEQWGYDAAKQAERESLDQDLIARRNSGEKILLEGEDCGSLVEPLPKYQKAGCEIVHPKDASHLWGRHRIVFGRDRHTRENEGYGGLGATTAGSIDIVVGSQGSKPNPRNSVGPNFYGDAARIYVSQRADIDRYFSLPIDESIGIKDSINRSAIGMKADSIRIIGREGIRLVTNARTGNSTPQEFNSRGEKIESDGPDRGIHLIAHERVGTYEATDPHLFRPTPSFLVDQGPPASLKIHRLQPLVKGHNLSLCIEEIVDMIADLAIAVENFSQAQMQFNTRLAFHTHPTTGGVAFPDTGNITGWAQATISQLKDHVFALGTFGYKINTWFKLNYLSNTSPVSFLSRYNKTN